MEEILHYLELKNDYYKKFLSISKKFLAKVENNRWDDITFFVDNRERILNIIRSYDFRIADRFEGVDPDVCKDDHYRHRVKSLLDQRAMLAEQIVKVDVELISKIDDIKTETIRELKKTMETSHQLDTFTGATLTGTNKKPVKTA